MPVDTPIACSLNAAEMPQRLSEARALGADALVGLQVAERQAWLHFRGERERIETLVGAERQCCSFLEFELAGSPAATELVIKAPENGEPMMRSLVAAIVAGWAGGL